MADATNTAAEPSFREQVESAEKQDAKAEPPEQVTEVDVEGPQEPEPTKVKEEKVVPLQALHEARALTKAERAANAQLRQQMAEFQRQQTEMLAYLATLQQPKVTVPDKATDPAGHLIATSEQTAEQVRALTQHLTRTQQEQFHREQQAVAEHQFRTAAMAADAEFHERQPDSADGIGFLKEQRVKMYEAGGLTKAQAQQKMLQDERELIAWCFQNGENPAERAYEMAKAAGYVPAKQKQEMQAAGRGASLPTQGAGVGGGKLSLDALAKLDSKAFLEATKGAKWKQMMSKIG